MKTFYTFLALLTLGFSKGNSEEFLLTSEIINPKTDPVLREQFTADAVENGQWLEFSFDFESSVETVVLGFTEIPLPSAPSDRNRFRRLVLVGKAIFDKEGEWILHEGRDETVFLQKEDVEFQFQKGRGVTTLFLRVKKSEINEEFPYPVWETRKVIKKPQDDSSS